jgi:hypothetical protein
MHWQKCRTHNSIAQVGVAAFDCVSYHRVEASTGYIQAEAVAFAVGVDRIPQIAEEVAA